MPATRRPVGSHDRIEPVHLVMASAVIRDVPESDARVTFGLAVFVPLSLVDFLLAVRFGRIALLGLMLALFVSVAAARRVAGLLLEWTSGGIHYFQVVRRLRPENRYKLPYGDTTSANGVHAGQLACPKNDYREQAKKYHEDRDRTDAAPVIYRLILATYPESKSQQVVAFTCGKRAKWYSTSNVVVEECPEMEALAEFEPSDADRRAACALDELVNLLAEYESGTSFLNVAEKLSFHGDNAISSAINIASFWKMISVSVDGPPVPSSSIRLTKEGFDWYLASPDLNSRSVDRRIVENAPEDQPRINIGTFAGIFNYAGGDISGTNFANAEARSLDDRILAAMIEILNLKEIPWSDPRLVEVRAEIESAVKSKNPRPTGLKTAISILQKVCTEIAFGVLGNGAYQFLVQHFL